MSNIVYSDINESGLDTIGHLWQKLNEYHRERSPNFQSHFSQMTFDRRKQWLLEKTKTGKMRIDLATDTGTREIVGFCISSVNEAFHGESHGEIDTLFVEEGYRRAGIGDALMKRALDWVETLSVKRKRIVVAVGNEEVLPFYRRYGFIPGAITLMQLDVSEGDSDS